MNREHPDRDLIALGIRQPWAELILLGHKTLEVRSRDTAVRGPIYVYASKKPADTPAARAAVRRFQLDLDAVPRGVLVGTVEIVATAPCQVRDSRAACVPRSLLRGKFGWRLAHPQRLAEPLAIRFLPYGVWFYPFRRRGGLSERNG